MIDQALTRNEPIRPGADATGYLRWKETTRKRGHTATVDNEMNRNFHHATYRKHAFPH